MRNKRWSPIPDNWDMRRQQRAILLGVGIGVFVGVLILSHWFPHANWFVSVAALIPFVLACQVLVVYGLRLYDRQRAPR